MTELPSKQSSGHCKVTDKQGNQKFCCCGTAPVEHFAVYVTTDDKL